ncbi:MAG TPA: PHB depolymerase family esterase [Steroidobacteraceae bacterium]
MQGHGARVVRALLPAVGAIAVLTPGAAADTGDVPATPALGLQTQHQFDAYSPLSASAEIVRRLLSPLAAAEVQRSLASSSERLSEQSIDLETERFVLYVPAHAPADGYALLAFVPPWDEAQLPHGWAPVLDRYGVIFVSAAHSGNSADVIGRREPLALLAAWNVMQRYRVDPQRVYVGGFSGGSRVALRLGLAYPDLFRGALLNAGSDPLDAGPPSPPPVSCSRASSSRRASCSSRESTTRCTCRWTGRASNRCVSGACSIPRPRSRPAPVTSWRARRRSHMRSVRSSLTYNRTRPGSPAAATPWIGVWRRSSCASARSSIPARATRRAGSWKRPTADSAGSPPRRPRRSPLRSSSAARRTRAGQKRGSHMAASWT